MFFTTVLTLCTSRPLRAQSEQSFDTRPSGTSWLLCCYKPPALSWSRPVWLLLSSFIWGNTHFLLNILHSVFCSYSLPQCCCCCFIILFCFVFVGIIFQGLYFSLSLIHSIPHCVHVMPSPFHQLVQLLPWCLICKSGHLTTSLYDKHKQSKLPSSFSCWSVWRLHWCPFSDGLQEKIHHHPFGRILIYLRGVRMSRTFQDMTEFTLKVAEDEHAATSVHLESIRVMWLSWNNADVCEHLVDLLVFFCLCCSLVFFNVLIRYSSVCYFIEPSRVKSAVCHSSLAHMH